MRVGGVASGVVVVREMGNAGRGMAGAGGGSTICSVVLQLNDKTPSLRPLGLTWNRPCVAGTPEERYRMCFEIYDVGKTGSITKAEMRQVLMSMNIVLRASENSNRSYSDSEIDAFVKSIFEEAGATEKLSLDDFMKAVSKHPELVEF